MAASEPRDLVERALGHLASGLQSVISTQSGDLQAQLKAMLGDWETRFRERVPRGTKTRVHELLDLRNKWAHPNPQETLDWSDAYRAANSALQLLRAVGGASIKELESLETTLIRSKRVASGRPVRKLHDNNTAELWLEAEPDSDEAMRGALRCPSCKATLDVVVKRNPDALTDKRPRFLLFDSTKGGQSLQVGHLFVGKILKSPVLYFGAVCHCGEEQRVVGFFNRSFNAPTDPHLVLVPHASTSQKNDQDIPF